MFILCVNIEGVKHHFNSEHGLTNEHPASEFKTIEKARSKAFELMTPELFNFFIVDSFTGESLQRV